MRSLAYITLATLLAALVSLSLQAPLVCTCPPADRAGHPLLRGKATSGGTLYCIYGDAAHYCQYYTVRLPFTPTSMEF